MKYICIENDFENVADACNMQQDAFQKFAVGYEYHISCATKKELNNRNYKKIILKYLSGIGEEYKIISGRKIKKNGFTADSAFMSLLTYKQLKNIIKAAHKYEKKDRREK